MELNTTNNAFRYVPDIEEDREKMINGETDEQDHEDGVIDLDMDASILLYPGNAVSEENEDYNSGSDDIGQKEKSGSEEPDSISDALIKCIRDTGNVDLPRIAAYAKVSTAEAAEALKGAIFCNPDTWNGDPEQGWEIADEYLSGNLRYKLIKARIANKTYKGRFEENLKAITNLLPKELTADSIYLTLGSPWIPTDVIEDFINYLIQPNHYDKCKGIYHDEETGSWEIPDKSQYGHYIRNTSTYGTKRIDAIHIIENTLNKKPVKITDEVASDLTKSGTKRIISKEDTAAALEKQRIIVAEFKRWIWEDKTRAARIKKLYEDRYALSVARKFNGGFLEFPGMAENVSLRPYQKDSVARILFTPNTLLAHDVGAGKTYIMIAAAMELKRLGMARKVMITVPNNIVDQWYDLFLKLYPDANVLRVKPSDFTPAKKNRTLLRIRQGDFDSVIIAYSCFDSIPLSRQCYLDELRAELAELKRIKEKKKGVTGKFKRRIESLEKKLGEAAVEMDPARELICFDELGVDRLFVDEAHNYKNVSIDTTVSGVLGISKSGSVKCNSMMKKVRFIQSRNNGSGIVMATGTPITNSITDIFVFQQYLQSGELELLGLQTFQSWVGMFAEETTEFEIAVDTNTYRLTTRFSRFHNIPELTTILASIADFHMLDDMEGLPLFKGYTDIKVPKSTELKRYLEEISRRADKVHNHNVSREEDNMLKITSDGRKAALDIRLTRDEEALKGQTQSEWMKTYWETGICKASECAQNAAIIYRQTAEKRMAQLIFCDISTPKNGFNIYDEVRRHLVNYGVADDDIAYIHEATTDAKREKLFAKVRSGEIRILIGSTFKLGLGVNIQDRLVALHHLDVPWRPADMVQREGRILRSGNLNPEIFIYRYITEGSFDAYSWQLLETKQRFIVDILSGSIYGRSGGEVNDTVLNYAEVKALALGNPLLKSRVETRNELSRLIALRKKSIENHLRLEQRYSELPDLIEAKVFELNTCISDAEYMESEEQDVYKNASILDKIATSRWRRHIRDTLAAELQRNGNRAEDRNILEYRGFGIVLPGGMDPDHPYLYLVREGRYRVELGEKDGGVLIRIDNYLERLNRRVEQLARQLELLRKEYREIELELESDVDYATQIEEVTAKLSRIDWELGVDDALRN